MPRPRQAQGRAGTPVIPARWAESHGVVAAKTMTLCVDLRHPGSTTAFDTDEGHSIVTPLAPYATGVPSRIQAHRETSQTDSSEQAEESLRVTGYLVTFPLSASLTALAVGDLIDVPTNCADDHLAGHALRIVEMVRGSLRFERDVFAVINDPAEKR